MQRREYRKLLNHADLLIIISSICIGTLSSIPKLFRLKMDIYELGIDVSIFSLFTLFVWYFNLYNLPNDKDKESRTAGLGWRFLRTLLLGLFVMALFVAIHQLLLPKYPLASMLGMYEFRGIVINMTISLFLFLFYQNHITNSIRVELEGIKMDNLNAQFDLLKQQVNPHFLFNSLSTLKSMVDSRDTKASHFIDMLSDFYRSSLEKKEADYTDLSKELKLLDAYLYLLKARYEDAFDIEISVSDDSLSACIPPFTLQLLMENCLKHNVVSSDNPLHIRIYEVEDHLVIENPIQRRRSVSPSAGIGLNNIRQRYRRLFDMDIETNQDDELFSIKLPLIYEDRNH